MILVDANLLIYARVSSLPQHPRARDWLDARLNESRKVGLPWVSLLGFARLATNRRIFERPLSIQQAWRQIESWLSTANVWIPIPTERHKEILSTLSQHIPEGGNLVPDADLAALAIEHGLILYSTDRDFAGFPELHWENPL